MQPIPTFYKNVKFRSRLEARWAVFFETLKLPWLYEEEGYQLPSGWYIPDFRLPRQKAWVEIKPGDFNLDDVRHSDLAKESGQHVFVIQGAIPFYEGFDRPMNDSIAEGCDSYISKFFTEGEMDSWYHWCRCQFCGEYGIEYNGRAERIKCCPENAIYARTGRRYCAYDEMTIIAAFKEARAAQFEFND